MLAGEMLRHPASYENKHISYTQNWLVHFKLANSANTRHTVSVHQYQHNINLNGMSVYAAHTSHRATSQRVWARKWESLPIRKSGETLSSGLAVTYVCTDTKVQEIYVLQVESQVFTTFLGLKSSTLCLKSDLNCMT